MPSWSEGRRPLTLAILALGGEGGGVLADWVVAVGERAGYWAQNTSVAGVAQRTGATVYYVELYPQASEEAERSVRHQPIMSLFPTPGEVDVVITSELMESGRAIQRGFSTPDRTTLITSTSRVYSIDEKIRLGDGRVDDTELIDAARRASKRLVAADFAALAEEAGSVISSSLFGALAGSGATPFSREAFEDAIRASGKGVDASLAAFEAGFRAATAPSPGPGLNSAPSDTADAALSSAPTLPVVHTPPASARSTEATKATEEARRAELAARDPTALVGPELRQLAERTRRAPDAARSMILHGLVRTAVYQDLSYAERYYSRVQRFIELEPDPLGEARLTVEAARHIALWMCYQDTIQVAMQKTRRRRMERVRTEAKAKPDQLLEVREFLHPRADEITDTLPTFIGSWLRRSPWFESFINTVTAKGMILNTTSVWGYLLLTTMARVRPLRPRSLRFGIEQQAIEQWIGQALAVAADEPDLACEIIECQRVLKGYGATWAHGAESFEKLMSAARKLSGSIAAAEQLAALREAALADEKGARLDAELALLAPASVG